MLATVRLVEVAMSDVVYAQLADALDRLPGRFPHTPSGAEAPLLRHLFTTEQAELGAAMGREYEPAAVIAAHTRRPLTTVRQQLDQMLMAGLVLAHEQGGERAYRLAQFLDGTIELWKDRFTTELARLFEAYMDDGGARVIMGSAPPYARVLPATEAARTEWILPFDDVRAIVEQTPWVVLTDCFCRVERAHAGSPCRFPQHVCLGLHPERPGDLPERSELLTREQALEVLDEAERAGLVHTVSNVLGHWNWLCNCCSCCCEFLRGLTHWEIDTAVVRNYRAVVDDAACTACGTCEDRCQVAAIEVGDRSAWVTTEHCIGCGLCVTACPTEAIELQRLPAADIVVPPHDHDAWEEERLRRRAES